MNNDVDYQVEKQREWLEVRVFTAKESYDAVTVALTNEGAGGIVEEQEGLVAYFPYVPTNERGDHAQQLVENIRQFMDQLPSYGLDPGKAEVTTTVRREDSWADAWKKYFKPQRIGTNIIIRPTWHEYTAMPDDVVVDLDPGMAFGTGTHATTRLCLELLEKANVKNKVVYDVGTGSGILAIVAARLGAKRVIGVDTDSLAVDVARDNINLNKVANTVSCAEGDWTALPAHERAEVAVANIIADVIIDMSQDVRDFLNPGGLLITSGIIDSKESAVVKRFQDEGFLLVERSQQEEWVALSFTYGHVDTKTNGAVQ